MKTFGEFFDTLSQWANGEGLHVEVMIFLDKWKDGVSEGNWEKVRALPMTEELFYDFVEEMAKNFRLRLSGISSYAILAGHTQERAQEFFRIVALKGHDCGLKVDEARLKF